MYRTARGPFVIQAPTFGTNNEGSSGTVEENALAETMNIVPNPANLSVQVVLPVYSNRPVEVFNALGQRMMTQTYQDELTLSIADWPSGVYVVRCGSAERVLVVRH